jgi:Na+-transporting NADH:ubiquinone oxidoreductase subunit A
VDGAPSAQVEELPAPDRLYLPLDTPRFRFDDVRVAEGQKVNRGETLAVDLERFSVPLLAPLGGTARLSEVDGHIVLDGLDPAPGDAGGAPSDAGTPEASPESLLGLGAWQFFSDARTREPVDPSAVPDAIIVSTLRLEPFLAGGEAQLEGALERLTRGLALLRSVFPGAALHVVTPDADETLADGVRGAAAACDGAHVVSVPMRYPFDDPALVARLLRLPSGHESHVWALHVEGVLAVEAALGAGEPAVDRVISFAGPAVANPTHFRIVGGYPLDLLLKGRVLEGEVRALNGGALTGSAIPPGQRGLDVECTGVTVLREQDTQSLLSFAMPGVGRRSYGRTFVGTLRTDMAMSYTTGLAGELRPCISCRLCEDVCPAGILPAVIHKQLYAGRIEEAQRLRVDLCVGCGLCSFVCPSKIDLRQELLNADARLREEAALIRAEAEAAAVAASAVADGEEGATGGEAGEGAP